MRARNPCLLMRRRLRGRYVGPMHSSREAGKRTPPPARRSRLTFPQAARSFGPPLLDVPPPSQSRMEQSTKEAWKRLLDEARRELPDATVRYTFQSCVVGKSNELAAAAAHAVAEAPGKTYNPLFIYGATGLGKTHLMQAVAHAVLTKYPGTRVHYFGAEQFINEVIESIH